MEKLTNLMSQPEFVKAKYEPKSQLNNQIVNSNKVKICQISHHAVHK